MYTMSPADWVRFWSKVDKHGRCWNWIAAKSRDGYGEFRLNGAMRKAHRVSYTACVGAIPDDLEILHSCDNPSCVNPVHLRADTHRQNMLEMWERTPPKLKSQRGVNNPYAKLNDELVRSIRSSPETGKSMAAQLGVSKQLVSLVRARRIWTHVA